MFNFDKAILGDPVWFNGKSCVVESYDFANQIFSVVTIDGERYAADKNGLGIPSGIQVLKTVPPKGIVSITVCIYQRKGGGMVDAKTAR
jgi:hypothetical protein